jgi:isopentenyl-diphosphate delta-isomerase
LSDPTSENRKKDHIGLAFESQAEGDTTDRRFYYEPMLSAHPVAANYPVTFLGRQLSHPLWISSMTGGTAMAGTINRNLARACRDFGIGMGLGSCRSLLYSNTYFEDFNLRGIIGPELPFFANLGIAQVESILLEKKADKIKQLVDSLQADGLIVHVNPLQEWLQPEGDRFQSPPIRVIGELLELASFPVIIKEVGQGMGPGSLEALLEMPLAAIDFGAYGGTNFSRLELLRSGAGIESAGGEITMIGHTAEEMVGFVNEAVAALGDRVRCKEVIISGGIRSYLDGYFCINKVALNAIYAQGSAFLKHAQGDYEALKNYVKTQVEGLTLAKSFLRVR